MTDTASREDAVVAAMVEELRDMDPMVLTMAAASALALAALVQLALRHPGVEGNNRAAGERYLARTRDYFDACPATLDILDRGDQLPEAGR